MTLGKHLCVHFVVSTERLGWPGKESGLFERLGLVQRKLRYTSAAEVPTATCHLLPSAPEPALCGYQWEGLITVPGNSDWLAIAADLRCEECSEVAATRL